MFKKIILISFILFSLDSECMDKSPSHENFSFFNINSFLNRANNFLNRFNIFQEPNKLNNDALNFQNNPEDIFGNLDLNNSVDFSQSLNNLQNVQDFVPVVQDNLPHLPILQNASLKNNIKYAIVGAILTYTFLNLIYKLAKKVLKKKENKKINLQVKLNNEEIYSKQIPIS